MLIRAKFYFYYTISVGHRLNIHTHTRTRLLFTLYISSRRQTGNSYTSNKRSIKRIQIYIYFLYIHIFSNSSIHFYYNNNVIMLFIVFFFSVFVSIRASLPTQNTISVCVTKSNFARNVKIM